MKKKDKSRRIDQNQEAEGQKRKKLKPIQKEKYKVRNVYLDDEEDDEEINLFDFENDQ